jgi:hypothetical protein
MPVAKVWVVEFQKCGLPHVHMLLILNNQSKLWTPEDIDNMVSVEILDRNTHPLAYEIVTKCMIHGSCGASYPSAPCMKDGKCSK